MTGKTKLGAALALLMAGVALPAHAFELTIIHTNDVHDRFEPITSSGSTCSEEQLAEAGTCFGGIARLAAAIEERREAAENALVLDAGDWFQGTLFFVQYGGSVAAEMINTIGFDAVAVGNHEFDNGPDGLDDFVNALDLPLLSANIDVVAHEIFHGVTEHTAGLVYRGQPGALNEHVSDVFGVLVKQRHLDQSADEADWLIGAELLLPAVQGEPVAVADPVTRALLDEIRARTTRG